MKNFKTLLATVAVLAALALCTSTTRADNGNGNDNDCTDVVCQTIQADTNCDGAITATDSLAILLLANGVISIDDVPCCAATGDSN